MKTKRAKRVGTKWETGRAKVIADFERYTVTEALVAASGNVSQAARDLGIDRVYLHRLMRTHGVSGGGRCGRPREASPGNHAGDDALTQPESDYNPEGVAEAAMLHVTDTAFAWPSRPRTAP